MDPAGNLYVTGGFATSLDLGSGALVTSGGDDVFLAKLDPATGLPKWAFHFGDDVDQSGVTLTADAAGHVTVTGTYIGTLALGGSAATLTSTVDSVFVAGFDAATGAALWAKNVDLGGGAIVSMATDPTDHGVVVIGATGSGAAANFGSGALTSGGGKDVVVAKYDSATGALRWAKQFGGAMDQLGQAVTVDASGNVLVTGQYSGTLDFGNGALAQGTSAQKRIFVARLKNDTGVGQASRSIGTAGQQQSVAIAADASANVVIGGALSGTVDFNTGTPLVSAGGQDAFVAKLAPDLSTLWAKRFGDAATQSTKGLAIDAAGNVVVTGYYQGTFAATPAATLISAGAFDAFVMTLDATTGAPTCARGAGDAADQTAARVVTGPGGVTYVLGTFISSIDWGKGGITGSASASETFLVELK